MPPIFVGKSDDYTRATAESSRRIGDEQVFAPERAQEDHVWNRLLRTMGMKYHVFQTNTPNVTDDEDLIKVMKDGERSGAITPRIARRIIEDILGKPLPDMSPDVELDIPFTLQMAEAVKNQANPVEPGQQVTALKSAHSDLMSNIIKREKALFGGGMPGLMLDSVDAIGVATGAMSEVRFDKQADVDGRTFALLDGDHCLALVSLDEGKSVGDSWVYPVDNVIPIEPVPYVSSHHDVGIVDTVELG